MTAATLQTPHTKVFRHRSAIQHVLASAATVDPEAAALLTDIRRQRLTGQTRIVTALHQRGVLDPDISRAEAADIVYACMSPEVHHILTAERGWSGDRYQRWVSRALRSITES